MRCATPCDMLLATSHSTTIVIYFSLIIYLWLWLLAKGGAASRPFGGPCEGSRPSLSLPTFGAIYAGCRRS